MGWVITIAVMVAMIAVGALMANSMEGRNDEMDLDIRHLRDINRKKPYKSADGC